MHCGISKLCPLGVAVLLTIIWIRCRRSTWRKIFQMLLWQGDQGQQRHGAYWCHWITRSSRLQDDSLFPDKPIASVDKCVSRNTDFLKSTGWAYNRVGRAWFCGIRAWFCVLTSRWHYLCHYVETCLAYLIPGKQTQPFLLIHSWEWGSGMESSYRGIWKFITPV